jgi:hypothetical protein
MIIMIAMAWFAKTKAFHQVASAEKIMTHHKNHNHLRSILIMGAPLRKAAHKP